MAQRLQPLLYGNEGQPAIVLSTDAIRAELYGDAAVQGPWNEIRAVLLQRLNAAAQAMEGDQHKLTAETATQTTSPAKNELTHRAALCS